MSKNKATVPDAWDDDWESQADKLAAEPAAQEPEVKLSKAERKAKHEEANRQLWEDADEVKAKPIFLQAKDEPAFKQDFKQPIKLLARKPPPKSATKDAGASMAALSLQYDEDSDEEERRKAAADFEERKAKTIREREEKQRKYQEARDRIMGGGAASETKPSANSGNRSRNSSHSKGRGGKHVSSNEGSPARANAGQRKQLFDPNYNEKSAREYVPRHNRGESGTSTPTGERPIREPRGPDGSVGFAARGEKGTSVS